MFLQNLLITQITLRNTLEVLALLDQFLITIILGLIQGITEWLPISSTAHLRIT